MRVSRVCQSLLLSFFIVIVLTCILATSFHANLPHNLSSRHKRSLPGSLAVAPAGAVGYYQPPPGPAVDQPQPTETLVLPPKTTTPTREIMHELRQVASRNKTTTNRPNHNTAAVTATATVTQRIMATDATAMADGGRALSTTGLYLSVLLAVLHL